MKFCTQVLTIDTMLMAVDKTEMMLGLARSLIVGLITNICHHP